MTLVDRVSAFFLAALAVCLAASSAATYGVVRWQRFESFDADLRNALSVLVAAIETEEDDVKWQPTDHAVSLGDERDLHEVRWAIVTDEGRVVDRSSNLDGDADGTDRLVAYALDPSASVEPQGRSDRRLVRRRLVATRAGLPKDDDEIEPREPDEFDALTVVAAKDARSLRSDLSWLAIPAIVLPAGIWLAAAIAGRWYCRKALRPLIDLAESARSAKAERFDARLPVPARIDEAGELALAFNSLLDRLAVAFERQRRFVGDAAHQLRTPLTALRGSLEVTLRRERTIEESRHALVQAADRTKELQDVVESLLFLARSDADAPLVDRREVDLATWLTTYALRWEDRPRFADLSFQVEPGATANFSPPLMQQALDNLVENALKYSERGTPIVVRAASAKREARLSVEDRGIGVPPEALEAIFEPFFRSQQARLTGAGGTGLGLALVKRIAEAHGGTAVCENVPGGGSRFTIRLPQTATDAAR